MATVTAKTAGLLIGTALTGILLLSACDRQGERLKGVKEVASASVKQITGETVVDKSETSSMRTVPVEARAIAEPIRSDLTGEAETRPMFAVLSVVAKPEGIPDAPAMAEIEDDALYLDDPDMLEDVASEVSDEAAEEFVNEAAAQDEPASGDGTAPAVTAPPVTRGLSVPSIRSDTGYVPMRRKIMLDPKARQKSMDDIEQATRDLKQVAEVEPAPVLKTRSLAPRSLEEAPVKEQIAARKLARRSVVTRDAIEAQTDANTVMLDALTKYKMAGEVTLSREGQMVIQIGRSGADPTQFSPEEAGKPEADFIALDDGQGCPENESLEAIQANPAHATECFIQELRDSGQFEYVEKDYVFETQFIRPPKKNDKVTPPGGSTGSTGTTGTTGSTTGTTTPKPVTPVDVEPNDPLWPLQWNFKNYGSGAGQSLGGASFQDFWSRQGTEGSAGVVVAVVDTGLQLNHPDILNSPNIAPGWDMVSDPRMGNDGDGRDSDPNDPGDLCNPSVPGAQDSFHGTHVAGTIGAAASNNGAGVAGGAWNVKIVPVRALGKCGGRLSDINDAIRWAAGLIPAESADGGEIWNDNPADIINLSIGLFEYCPASLQDAIDSVTERGAIVVAAAGNARIETQFYAPGGCNNVISVAAGNAIGAIASYSNFGPEVDILAPGGEMKADDDNDNHVDGILSTKASSNCYDPVTGEAVADCYYAYMQGTSMAAPHVSAALALLKSRDPAATPAELEQTLMAATESRQPLQCSGLCTDYPGTTPLEGSPNMCTRPCGEGLLNLARVPVKASSGGGK